MDLPKFITRKELVELVNGIENDRDKLLFLFGGTMGLRVSSAVNCKVAQYNKEERVLTIVNDKKGDRLVPVPDYTGDFIDFYIEKYDLKPEDYFFCIRIWRGGKVEKRKKPITRWHADKLCKKYGKRIGIPKLHFHMLRSCYVTILLERGVDPITIKENCGWTDMRMLEVYAHLMIEKRKEKTNYAFSFLGSEKSCQLQRKNPRIGGIEKYLMMSSPTATLGGLGKLR